MLPEFVETTGYLPPGRHAATWHEVEDRFATNTHRAVLTSRLLTALVMLRKAGCTNVFLNGSYVTDKDHPGDVDVLYEAQGVQPQLLDPLFRSEDAATRQERAKVYGAVYDVGDTGLIAFFQTDRADVPKGIVTISLSSLPKVPHDH